MRLRLLWPALGVVIWGSWTVFGSVFDRSFGTAFGASPPRVALTEDRLLVDGKAAPFLFGAEVQYFRARGAAEDRGRGDAEAGRNVPAADVEALWRKLLGRAREAGMNTVTFYIPWDFHEPAPGLFDFDGTLDRDGDGRPDYPSRNVKKFLSLVEEAGFRYVMLRPGPYINAEWGPTGFGALPRWFLEDPKYAPALAKRATEALAATPEAAAEEAAKLPRVATFHHPLYRERVKAWFQALKTAVLDDALRPGKPAVFLQLDNETNYFWGSLYERDWNPVAIDRYRAFVKERYRGDAAAVAAAYGGGPVDFATLLPPKSADDRRLGTVQWHADWMRFHEVEVREYHRWLRTAWEDLGVKEPDVLFTTCDSFNAPEFGMVPRLDDRQAGQLSLSTMNVYPKTYGDSAQSTLNVPMKAAHDAAVFAASHASSYGNAGDWLMVTETMGGWFPPTQVSLGARQHTYGSLLGTAVKALVVYYFHEGWNWTGLDGKDVSEAALIDALRKYDIGIAKGAELRFDAPLDRFGNPRKDDRGRSAFAILKSLGRTLSEGLGEALLASKPVTAPVLLAQDHDTQASLPGHRKNVDEATTLSAGTYGWLREGGYLPDLRFLDAVTDAELEKYRVVVLRPRPGLATSVLEKLRRYVDRGGRIWWLGPTAPAALGTERVTAFAEDPSRGWNGDDYPKLAHAAQSLLLLRTKMGEADVEPVVAMSAPDGKPFVHGWLRRVSDGRWLLFVENFLRSNGARTVRVHFGPGAGLPEAWKITARWLAADSAQQAGDPGGRRPRVLERRSGGVSLGASADGVDVWEIEAE